jgi:hypothetical protein
VSRLPKLLNLMLPRDERVGRRDSAARAQRRLDCRFDLKVTAIWLR